MIDDTNTGLKDILHSGTYLFLRRKRWLNTSLFIIVIYLSQIPPRVTPMGQAPALWLIITFAFQVHIYASFSRFLLRTTKEIPDGFGDGPEGSSKDLYLTTTVTSLIVSMLQTLMIKAITFATSQTAPKAILALSASLIFWLAINFIYLRLAFAPLITIEERRSQLSWGDWLFLGTIATEYTTSENGPRSARQRGDGTTVTPLSPSLDRLGVVSSRLGHHYRHGRSRHARNGDFKPEFTVLGQNVGEATALQP